MSYVFGTHKPFPCCETGQEVLREDLQCYLECKCLVRGFLTAGAEIGSQCRAARIWPGSGCHKKAMLGAAVWFSGQRIKLRWKQCWLSWDLKHKEIIWVGTGQGTIRAGSHGVAYDLTAGKSDGRESGGQTVTGKKLEFQQLCNIPLSLVGKQSTPRYLFRGPFLRETLG